MALLVPPRRFSVRLERRVARPELASTRSVSRVGRLDGRTRIVAVRTVDGWQPGRRLRWTRQTIGMLRGPVREVLLERHFQRARVPLAWIPAEPQR
jgi:hypothetical protein